MTFKQIVEKICTLKVPAKMHLKMPSDEVIYRSYLLTILANISIEANNVDPDQIAAESGSFCCFANLTKIIVICYFSNDNFFCRFACLLT